MVDIAGRLRRVAEERERRHPPTRRTWLWDEAGRQYIRLADDDSLTDERIPADAFRLSPRDLVIRPLPGGGHQMVTRGLVREYPDLPWDAI